MSDAVPVVVSEDRSGLGDSWVPSSLPDLADLMSAVLDAEGVDPTAEAGLHLIGESEMTELNGTHMGSEGPTDVLSFAVDGAGSGGEAALVGDVLICPQVAASQAGEHAGTELDELRLLVVHGSLHLCGWDHADEAGRSAMWSRERALMEQFEVLPSRDAWEA